MKLNVKWGTSLFQDIEIDPSTTIELFKMQLYSLTDVEPERQKILYKGVRVKDDNSLSSLPPEALLHMFGTKAAVPKERKHLQKEEDSHQTSQTTLQKTSPASLVNLGNTCYISSAIQLLFGVKDIKERIEQAETGNGVLIELKNLFGKMESGLGTQISPVLLVSALRNAFPQFQGKNDKGFFEQQDAAECWDALLSSLNTPGLQPDIVGSLFQGELSVSENITEKRREPFTEILCPITTATNTIEECLEQALREKHEPEKTRISSLPQYLVLKKHRFFWKKEEQVVAKILKKIAFPLTLDVSGLCTEELRSTGPEPFTLIGVLTHTGRSSSSGHYIAWVKDCAHDGLWWKMDDQTATEQKDENILGLSGGGDWHMAYMLLYRRNQPSK
ncbi:MAG: ubiquitin C-terminal hydrolase Ubp6 [Amphiamblys sp. WSBS2006]|nr:MAG: ubiquitin C-terminal hydrolase Ubp6 [Amphiamblys sp. WSBS2006]